VNHTGTSVNPTPKLWRVSPPLSAAAQSRFHGFHPILAQILVNRGYADPAEAAAFLSGAIAPNDPFRMKGMNEAVSRIRRAISRREPIVVYGDFDADGVTSAVLLVTALKALGAVVKPYIPHRVDEGYGLNVEALDRLKQDGARLVITVDCGIRSLREVAYGISLGLDMIVTDHHSVGPEVPECQAVINPKQPGCRYGEDMLAGVGVAFKLAEGLLKATRANDRGAAALNPEDLLDLVAIGTVADLAPLDRAENRALVMAGLQQIRLARRPGVRALLQAAGMPPERVDATAIGFTLGPRINAAGRLDSAMLAYELLATEDVARASELAAELQSLNAQRQQLTREMQDYARRITGLEPGADIPLIFVAHPGFAPGIIGLVAGRLVEEFYRPTIIVHQDEGESHGSCRSIPEFDITAALDHCADLLTRHGGHAQAAGFALPTANLPAFEARITSIAAASLEGLTLQPALDIDAEVPLQQVDMALYDALRQLEPVGQAMRAPILCTRRLRVIEARAVGREMAHLRLRLSDGKHVVNGIAFRFGALSSHLPEVIDVAYQVELNEWNGSRSVELHVVDIDESR
jgi:single-stranded-DNA-specific exonuclease